MFLFRWSKRPVQSIVVLAAFSSALTACVVSDPPPPRSEAGDLTEGQVNRVIDGDSIEVDGRSIRLIGVNAPERGQPFYSDARDALRDLVGGETVWLEHDVEVRDQYGRELAYVFLTDGRHANEELLSAGFAQAYTIPPNVSYDEDFHVAERDARAAGRGLWKPSDVAIDITEVVFNPPGRDGDDLNGEWVTLINRGSRSIELEGLVLSDESNNVFELPDRDLAAGARLKIHSGTGRPSDSQLYWGRDRPLWNNDGDTAILRGPDGELIARFAYEGERR